MSLDFKDKVAIVTGSGNGIGKGYALELAKRGAKVVVNDLGGTVDGSGGSLSAADAVVQEIEAAGGEAMANGANVAKQEDVKAMVQATMEKWGRVDILINNAGILRDKSFGKMEWSDFEAVINVHLLGSALCAHGVFPIMKEQEFGRIVMTSSSSGLFGNFGQTNYAAAKMGVVGLMNTLKLEGAKYNVHTNSIAPTATTRMTEHLFPAEFAEKLDPKYIIPAVIFLASEKKAKEYAKAKSMNIDSIPYIKGWGHQTGPITYKEKIDFSQDKDYIFPHVKKAIDDAFTRAGMEGVKDIDGIETHDCFTSTEYMAIDHFGITKPGESWKAIESGEIEIGGRIPINASGGLIGLGHPVGATGVRMLLDCYKQCTNLAGEYQIENAKNVSTLNIGGSATTVVSFVVGRTN